MRSKPNQIKEYYIAYFDILGYKEFFKKQSDSVPKLLDSIHNAIEHTNNRIENVNNSPIMNELGNIDIKIKVFSDNILLCMDMLCGKLEQLRLLAFFQIVADIQCGFVNDYALFVRGGICKGTLSFNENYVFGQGLVDVVTMEARAKYPRIIISDDLIEMLGDNRFVSQDDHAKAEKIEKKIINKNSISTEEQQLYSQVLFGVNMNNILQYIASQLVILWPDGKWILSYLNLIDITELIGIDIKKNLMSELKNVSPYDYQLANTKSEGIDISIQKHKEKIEEKLLIYGSNADINLEDSEMAELRESILHKYIWSMAYHNDICERYSKTELKILTRCNCDKRFLKMTIDVLHGVDMV